MGKKATKKIKPEAKAAGVLSVQARYDAASQGRRMMGWNAPSSGPNKAVTGLQTIRNRSRDAGRNEWVGASSARVMTTNLVGVGITARVKTKAKAIKAKLTEEWDKWVEVADADGVLDFYGLQTLVVRTWFQAGEVFVRVRPRRLYDGLPAPVQLQVLEADLVPVFDADQWPGMTNGNRIKQGIEFDRIGRRVAYWMHREHPGDNVGSTIAMNELVRVTADQVMHIYNPLRPGQLRGVPDSAPILAKMRSVMDFDDNVLTRQRLANLFTMFITRPMPTNADASIDPLTGKTISYDADGAPMAAMEPGLSQELLPGEDVKFSAPPDTGANYADFMREQKLGIAAGQGTPYELVTGDVKDVSDRTLRVIINEFRRYCEQIQWQIIIPQFCKPARAAWSRAAYLAGVINEAEADESLRVDWSPHGWAYIHPVQDVQGKQLEVESGFRSRSSVITEKGNDPDAVDSERADDDQRERDLGLKQEMPDPAEDPAKQAEAEAANAKKDEAQAQARLLNAKAKRELDEAAAVVLRANAEAERARADASLLIAKAKEAEAAANLTAARIDLERAEAAERTAANAAAEARAANESAARIAALDAEAEAARSEAASRAEAMAEAEAFARQQREIVLKAERDRAEVAALEKQAAELGLAELQAG